MRAIITFGRFQPITQGHAFLFDFLKTKAIKLKAIPLIFASHTKDKKNNPLSYEEKAKILEYHYPNIFFRDDECKCTDIFKTLEFLDGTISDIIIVVGPDRYIEMKEKIEKYNGMLYNFKSINVICLNSQSIRRSFSGTKTRKAAIDGNFKEFENCVISGTPKSMIEDVYYSIRRCYGK